MTAYSTQILTEKKFDGNIVIQFAGVYYSNQQPDSGLVISSPYSKSIKSLQLNPTSVDVRRVTTTISSFTFSIVDISQIITSVVLGDAANLIGQEVRIWLGRSNFSGNPNLDMPFSDYYELPRTYIKKIDHSENAYNFTSTEQTERMDREIFAFTSALGADILAATTIITMRDSLSGFPSSGFLKIDDEFLSYSAIDLVNNRFTGVVRGELGTMPADHALNTNAFFVQTITDNPLNIILKLLISGGGGGTYDVLQSGLGISNTLIDIAEIEALRDELFLLDQFTLSLYQISSALKYIEKELLLPNDLRFTTSINSKLTLAALNRAKFVEEDDIINHSTMTKFPKWSLDGNKVSNYIEINWEYIEATKLYNKKTIFQDATSISAYGKQVLTYSFKGITSALNGQDIINNFGTRILSRLSLPTPEIEVTTQLDKSLQTIGGKSYLVSNLIPAANGTLNFSSDLEIVSRSINHQQGEAKFKLAFTSYTNIRSGFIAPSDLFIAKTSQSVLSIALGRGLYYKVGWKMRLWNNTTQVYEADPVNTIIDIVSDTIFFQNAWTTTITVPNNFRMRFADYDDAVDSEKRYGFISTGVSNFPDGQPPYKVTY
ncbi:MAG: hypothetical protein ACK5YR_16565 [Pirellula sp.]|jgi:hypothetical protein